MSRLPFLKLESDITNVVYLTWLVPANLCEAFVPPGARLWQRDELTPFTILTYQHGNFGPSALRSLRRVFPSPLQSNWRLYLDQAPEGAPPVRTVLFLKNVMNSVAYSVSTRVFSDVLSTHLAAEFVHRRQEDLICTEFTSGSGSSPSLECTVRCSPVQSLSPRFVSMFGSWSNAVEFLACQDAAVAYVERAKRLAFAEIELPIDLSCVFAAEVSCGSPKCSMLLALQPVEGPLCFVIPRVRFRALSERLL
jgi:hypothetical protein